MIERKYKVYIRVNEKNEIIDINSEIFIEDFSIWVCIDEGSGDKFALAQNNYLEDSLIDIEGNYRYRYEKGQIIDNK